MRDIYSIIVCIDTCGLTEGYLQYHCMHWYLWSYRGIFTVSSYVLIPVVLLRDIYSIIVCIDTSDLLRDIYVIIVYIDTSDLTEGYLQYHRIYWYPWSYWGIFTVSSYVLIPVSYWGIFTLSSYVLILRDIYRIIVYLTVILMRDIYSIIVCIDTFDLTGGYLQYHQPDSDNGRFDLTEGYLQYHRMYWYLWSYWEIFTVSSAWLW